MRIIGVFLYLKIGYEMKHQYFPWSPTLPSQSLHQRFLEQSSSTRTRMSDSQTQKVTNGENKSKTALIDYMCVCRVAGLMGAVCDQISVTWGEIYQLDL